MAKEIVLKTKVEGTESVQKTINAFTKLKSEVKAAKGELANFEIGTEGFNKAQKKIQDLQDKLGDLGDATKIEGTGVERLGKSFGLLTESLNTADFSKAKIAFQGIGSAMKAIPIFLLIEGIKLLIDNFGAVADFAKSFTTEAKEQAIAVRGLTTAFGELAGNLEEIAFRGEGYLKGIDQRNKLAIESAKQRGAKETEINQLETESNKKKFEVLSNIENNFRKQKEFADSQYIKALKVGDDKKIEEAKALLDKATSLHKESRVKMQDFNNELVVNEAKSLTTNIENRKAAQKKELDEYKKHQKELYDAFVLAKEKSIDSTREAGKTVSEIESAEQKKLQDERNKADNIAFAKELNTRAAIKALWKLSTQDKIDALTEQKEVTLRNTELTEQQRVAIIRKYNEDVAKLNKESLNQTLNSFQQLTSAIASVANNVVGVFASAIALMQQNRQQELAEFNRDIETKLTALNESKEFELEKEGLTNQQRKAIQDKYAKAEYELKLQQYNAETTIKKKAFEQDKKLKIAQTVISTITGAVSALVSAIASSIPYPYNIVAGVISAAAVAASGAIQIAQIKAQKFDAGTPPSPPKLGGATSSSNSAGGGSQKPTYNPPDLQKVGGENSGGEGSGDAQRNSEPQKVYVISSDISNQQNKDAILERRATY